TLNLLAGSFAFGALAVAVLLSHQPPQVLTDFAAGKMSFAVRHGVDQTYRVARGLTIISLVLLASLFLKTGGVSLSNLFCVIVCFFFVVGLPKRLSPPVVLKSASLMVASLGFLVKVRM
ncbi:hypothetical protein EBT16_02090, partial [bacterium]|nr:hypothetical protein [bacterium]